MTRVNVVPPKELSVKHLVAEYREIARIPGYLRRSLSRISKPFSAAEIPAAYTLGTGHVKFFYDKMKFLRKRYIALIEEMKARGYSPNFTDPSIFDGFDEQYCKDYKPDKTALEINRQRIKERG